MFIRRDKVSTGISSGTGLLFAINVAGLILLYIDFQSCMQRCQLQIPGIPSVPCLSCGEWLSIFIGGFVACLTVAGILTFLLTLVIARHHKWSYTLSSMVVLVAGMIAVMVAIWLGFGVGAYSITNSTGSITVLSSLIVGAIGLFLFIASARRVHAM